MDMKISKRISDIPMSGIRKMFDLAGPDSINLGLGEPDLDPPKEAVEGMNAAASAGRNKYGPTAGIMELRDAVADYFSKYGRIDGNNIMITPSGSTALLEVTQSMVDPGDEVLGLFQPDIDYIQSKITPRTSMIIVNTPSNPTGGVLTEESKKALCDIARDRNITILADEVYNEFIYEGRHVSFMDSLDCAVVANGFSKMMAVTGWRMGFLCAEHEVMDTLIKMQYHVCASPAMPPMYGILAALPHMKPYLDNARKVYRARRDLITDLVNDIPGMHLDAPRGAFYAFPTYEKDVKSADLANDLARAGLICTPGSAFGTFGEGHLRFSYAADESKIQAGMAILKKVITEGR